MKTRIANFLVPCILIVLLAACGGAKTTSTPAPIPTPASTAETAPAAATVAAQPTAAPAATLAPTPTSAPAPTTAPTKAPEPAQPSGNARDQILAAYEKMFGLPYRNESTIKSDSGEITQVGEFAPPDRLRAVTQAAGFETEMIIIGENAWSRQAGGDWTALPSSVAMSVKEMQSMAEETMTDAEALGSQTLDGRKVWVYRFQSAFEGVKSTTTLFVDAATGLPVQQEVVGEAAGIVSTTLQKISYPDAIVIEAPVP